MSKKMYCLLLAFVMLLAVSAVSAAENIDDASLAADDSTDTIAVDEIVDDVEADSADDSDKLATDEKLDPKLNVTTKVSDYGDIGINVTTEKNATGTVTINITNSSGLVMNDTGILTNGSYYLGDLGFNLPKGEYLISVFYQGDANYTNATANPQLLISKSVPDLDVIPSVNKYGIIEIIAVLNTDATGNVTFNIVRKGETPDPKNGTSIEIKNGNATFDELYRLEKGEYEIYVDYNGDKNYYATYKYHVEVNSTKVLLNPNTTSINVTGGEVNVTVDLGAPAQGNVTVVYPSGYKENVTIKNGIVEIYNSFPKEQGNLSFVLDYDGDANYYGFYQYYVDFFIKYDSNLTVKSEVNEFGQIVINASVNKTATGTITFIIKDSADKIVANVTKTVENGTASYAENTPFAKGNYTFEVIYSGDDIFANATYALGEANVTKDQVNVTDTVKVAGNEAEILINLGNATGKVTVFFLNYGSNLTYNITNGTVLVDQIFDNGNQSVLVTYDGDANYYGFYEYYIDFYVKASSFISAAPVSVVYQNNGKVTVTLTDNNDNGTGKNPIAGVNVTVTLNGKQYVGVTDAKGIATITIPANLVPKAYTATVSYAGNATCNGDENTFIFTVTKATPKITAKKKTFKAKKKTKKYTVTLKAGKNPAKGVKVTLKIKGKKAFSAKTNAKGKATFKITKLTKKGKYKAVIKSKANSYYKAAAKKKVKITVK